MDIVSRRTRAPAVPDRRRPVDLGAARLGRSVRPGLAVVLMATICVSSVPLLYHAFANLLRELMVDAQPRRAVLVEALVGLAVTLEWWHRMVRRCATSTEGG